MQKTSLGNIKSQSTKVLHFDAQHNSRGVRKLKTVVSDAASFVKEKEINQNLRGKHKLSNKQLHQRQLHELCSKSPTCLLIQYSVSN